MNLLNCLRMLNHSCEVRIEDGEYVDISRTGILGMNQKQSSVRLNNGIISGISCSGRTKLIDTILYDATNAGKAVIYVRNRVNSQVSGQYGTMIESGAGGNKAVIININRQSDGINLLKGMPLDRIRDSLIEIMSNYILIDDGMKDFCITWYNKIFEVLKLSVPKEKIRLNGMEQYTFDWLKARYDRLYKNRRLRQTDYDVLVKDLQKIRNIYQAQMIKFMDFARIIKTSGIARLLSGAVTLREIYEQGMILMVNLCEGVNPRESAVFLKLLLQRLLIEETLHHSGAVCVFEDCNIKNNAMLFLDLLKAVQAKKDSGSIYFTERNITWWRENLSQLNEHPAGYCNSFFIFRQGNPEDLKFWSALSGATKKTEVTHNSAPLACVHPLEASSWGNFILNCCMVYTGSSSREIDAYRIEAREIDELDDNSCIAIIKMEKEIYNRRVTWNE